MPRLPWRNRFVGPEHEQTIASVQVVADQWLLFAAPVQFFQQYAFAFIAGIGAGQPRGILRVGGTFISSHRRRLRSLV